MPGEEPFRIPSPLGSFGTAGMPGASARWAVGVGIRLDLAAGSGTIGELDRDATGVGIPESPLENEKYPLV